MPKASKPAYYAVAKGYTPGVYLTWAECEAQVKGFNGARYKKFPTPREAEEFARGLPSSTTTASSPPNSPVKANVAGPSTTASVSTSSSAPVDGNWTVIYSDGACKGNGKAGSVAGVGVWYGPNDHRNLSERCPGEQTNNRAELIALIRVLELEPFGKHGILIRSDSKYSITCVTTWIKGWRAKNWKTASGGPVKNRAVIEYLSALLGQRAARGQRVKLEYVKGHSGEVGNDGADALAVRGCFDAEVQERKWGRLMAIVEADLEDEVPVAAPVAKSVEVDIQPSDLLTEEQMRMIAETGDFDMFD